MTWYDAVSFCNWLSKKENLDLAYNAHFRCFFTANGYRLPTEAEWEYLARGGLEKNLYSWENTSTVNGVYFANFAPPKKDADRFFYTAPVGSYPKNGYGLFDMLGNVSEWCNDWYNEDAYKLFQSNTISRDPWGPDDGSEKVCRGGSWISRKAPQCALREYAHPADQSNARGFRVVRIVPPATAIQLGEYKSPDTKVLVS
jgi:formylglycine-generating enzyme required for sulfatase activity